MPEETKAEKAAAKTAKAAKRTPAVETPNVPAEPDDEPASGVEGETDAPAATTVATTVDDADEVSAAALARLLSERIYGILTVHYPARDVEIPMDGAHALDLLALFASGGPPRALDPIGATTVASRGFAVLDTMSPLGMTWTPTHRAGIAKTTVDPGEPIT